VITAYHRCCALAENLAALEAIRPNDALADGYNYWSNMALLAELQCRAGHPATALERLDALIASLNRKRFTATLGVCGVDSGWLFWNSVPGHQLVDALLGPAVHQACQQVGDVDLRIDAIELAGLDQRRHARPVLATFVAAGEQTIFSR
jgi:hypothetical protein